MVATERWAVEPGAFHSGWFARYKSPNPLSRIPRAMGGGNRPPLLWVSRSFSDWRTRKMRLSGAAAIVTGGGSGLGRATAEALAAKGAKVGVVDLNPAAAEDVAKAIGGLAVV